MVTLLPWAATAVDKNRNRIDPNGHRTSLRCDAVNRLVEETIQLQRSNFQSRRVTITSELDPDTPHVFADPGQLRQVLVNLLSNAADAIEAAGRPGQIHISTSARLGVVRVSVEDDGP